jgi:Protein of unknown function (DUF4231)
MSDANSESPEPLTGYARLDQQINWYDSKSGECQWWYKRTKICEFILSSMVPATAMWSGQLTAVIGVAAVVLEGLQQLNQWQHNWITYRSTCEALRHEKYTFLGRSGVYSDQSDAGALRVLVERTEALISTEHAKWISRQEYSTLERKGRDKNPSEGGSQS